MKHNLKVALDTALRDMDWHGEAEVLQAVRAAQKGGRQRGTARRLPVRALVLAALLLALMVGTALALGFHFSGRYQAQRQAAEAVKAAYGLTDEMLDLFTTTRTDTETGWSIRFARDELFYGKDLGEYTAQRQADGSVTAAWNYDQAGQAGMASGDLASPVWGAAQLAQVLPLLRQRLQSWQSRPDVDTLTLEEAAALDAPLLELSDLDLLLYVLPGEKDLPAETAREIAAQAVIDKYGLSSAQLDACETDMAFLQYGGVERREYRFDFFPAQRGDDFVVYVASPSGQVVWCRWLVAEENRTLPDSDLSLYPEAAAEYITTGAFDLLDADARAQVAARYEAAGLAALLPDTARVAGSHTLTEEEAVQRARAALEAAFQLSGDWQELYQVRTGLTADRDQQVWEIVWRPCVRGNWHWMDADRLGIYTVRLDDATGEALSCSWSLAGLDTAAYTENTFGQAEAYAAYMLPWVSTLLNRAQAILDTYPADAILEDMTLADRAAYDQLFRGAGYSWRQYSAALPGSQAISQEEAASLSLEAIQAVYGVSAGALHRGEAFQEGFELFEAEDGGLITVWKITWGNGTDTYTTLINAQSGDIEQLWHDDLSIGNG